MALRAAGISWFREDEYLSARNMMIDAHVLPPTYREWLRKAEGQESRAKATELTVIRIMIDPDEFLSWCKKNGLKPDAKARTAFAAEGAMEQVKRTH